MIGRERELVVEKRTGATTHPPGVGTWIERRARVAPERVALIHGDTRLTYAALASRVRRLASGLRSLGVTRADRVAWIGDNHPAFLEALFAVAKLGAVLTPINHRLEASAVDAILRDVSPRVVLQDGAQLNLTAPLAAATTVGVHASDDDESGYERLIAGGVDAPIDELVSPEDLCFMPFTSGTTGAPKGIMLTHGNLTWNVVNCLASLDIHGDDITVAAAPFFRAGGTGVNVLPVFFQGGTVVVPRTSDPDEVFHLIERHRATIGFGNPNLLEALVKTTGSRPSDFCSLRAFVTGGASVSARLLRACRERGLPVLQGYGLSEAAPFVAVLDARYAWRKVGSAGRPALFVDTRIVGPDGADVADGEIGELLVRGPNVMAGYWRRPNATARALNGQGWLRTGDAVRMDADGFLFIVGRVEDAYMSCGQLVHPGIAEHLLRRHPSVADACVLGHVTGAIAYLVLAAGATPAVVQDELSALCDRHLDAPARPVAFKFVGSLPRNPAGKILRQRLREDHARSPAGLAPTDFSALARATRSSECATR